MHRIMVVDDDKNIVRALSRSLTGPERTVDGFTDPLEALRHARVTPLDLILVDYRMPEMDGLAFLTEVRTLQPEALRILVSAFADLHLLMGAINDAEVYRFIAKPWEEYDLRATVRSALLERDLRSENRRLANELRRQRGILERIEQIHPGLTQVEWAPDGSILIDEETME